ncbi:MAG: hypothetical protein NT154_35365, partial [Verrucomicrobia bacterium]|nr:hypothetical protein [Verrucomicrobiota bacterium]
EGALNLSHNSIFNEQRVLDTRKTLALVVRTHPSLSASTSVLLPTIFPAIQGTKNPSADLITSNSASRTFVNSRSLYQNRAGCQRFIFFFLPVLLLATSLNLPFLLRLSKSILVYFPPQKSRIHKERGAENILS